MFASEEHFDDARPKEILLPGQDLSSTWNGIVQDAIQKIAAGYEYRLLQQNSNTFVGTLLRDAGFKQMPTGSPIGMSFIPGLHECLFGYDDIVNSLGAASQRPGVPPFPEHPRIHANCYSHQDQ
jgi:hypothetical protein